MTLFLFTKLSSFSLECIAKLHIYVYCLVAIPYLTTSKYSPYSMDYSGSTLSNSVDILQLLY